jgi:hypothetical protein
MTERLHKVVYLLISTISNLPVEVSKNCKPVIPRPLVFSQTACDYAVVLKKTLRLENVYEFIHTLRAIRVV